MDVVDEAQQRTAFFNNLAMQHRAFDLAPVPASKTDLLGNPLCIECDVNIKRRREVQPNTQRCTDCQTNYEKRSGM